MNYYKKLATEVLGLVWDDDNNRSEKFTLNEGSYGLLYISPKGLIGTGDSFSLRLLLTELLSGEKTIKRGPWNPREGDYYYYIVWHTGEVTKKKFTLKTHDLALLANGWLFRSEQEANENKERVLEEIRELRSGGN